MTGILQEEVEELLGKHIAPVHIVNPEDLRKAPEIKEADPEHFVTNTYVLVALTTTQILEVDAKRKEAVIALVGTGNSYICHSRATADKVAAGSTTDGAVMPPNTNITAKGRGPLWVVAASGSTISVGVFQDRWQ